MLNEEKIDIIYLCETYLGIHEGNFKEHPQYTAIGTQGENKSKGSFFLIKNNELIDSENCAISEINDTEGARVTLLTLKFKDRNIPNLRILGVYAPNNTSDRKKFFANLLENVQEQIDVCLGDFNCVTNISDRNENANCNEGGQRQLLQLIEYHNLRDCYESTELTTYPYSHHQQNHKSRIDRIYINDKLSQAIASADTKFTPVSDHAIVSCKIIIKQSIPKNTQWRMNPALMSEAIQIIEKLNTNLEENTLLKWAELKENIKKQLSKHAKKNQNKQKSKLKSLLTKLTRSIENDDSGSRIDEIVKSARDAWNKLSESNKRKSKYNWRNLGEKSTRYNFMKIKPQRIRSSIYALQRNDDTTTDKFEDMSQEVHSFYQKLFASDHIEQDELKNLLRNLEDDLQGKKVTDEENENLCKNISQEELDMVVKTMAKNKSPGPDGLPAELYQHSATLRKYLLTVLNHIMKTSETDKDFLFGIITLLYKKNDPTMLKNYRPISLLNTDYKIFTKIIALRLSNALSKKISANQHAFLKDRLIHDNIMEIQMLIELAEREGSPGFLVFLDQEKAYDRVEHEVLWKTLSTFGINEKMINIIRSLYSNAESGILLNGARCTTVQCKRGVRQGDPLSCILYVCVMELMRSKIEQDRSIEPTELKHLQAEKVKMYADDSVVAVKNKQSLLNLFENLKSYERGTGARFNVEKTEILPLGSDIDKDHNDLNLKTTKRGESIRHLGCPVGYDLNLQEIWEMTTVKIKKILHSIKIDNQSIYGKALAIQSLGASQIWFKAKHLPIQKQQMDTWERMFQQKIWSGKLPKVNYQILSTKIADGGINAPSIRARIPALHVDWIKRYIENPDRKWAAYVLEHFRLSAYETKDPRNTIVNPFIQDLTTTRFSNIPRVWLEIYKTWKELKGEIDIEQLKDLTKDQIKEIPLWKMKPHQLGMSRANEGATLLKHHNNAQRLGDVISPSGKRFRPLEEDSLTPRKKRKIYRTLEACWEKFNSPLKRKFEEMNSTTETGNRRIYHIMKLTIDDKTIGLTENNLSKTLYQKLTTKINKGKPISIPKSYLLYDQEKALKSLWNTDIPKKWIETTYLACLGRHPIKYRILSRKPIEQRRCCCGEQKLETHRHLFFTCNMAKEIWKEVIEKWGAIQQYPHSVESLMKNHILKYGFGIKWNKKEKKPSQLWRTLYCLTIRAIWLARNDSCFNQEPYNATKIRTHLIASLNEIFQEDEQNKTTTQLNKKWINIHGLQEQGWLSRASRDKEQ